MERKMVDGGENHRLRYGVSLGILCGVLAALILLVDLATPLGIAAAVPYIAVVLLSLKSPRTGFTILIAILCTALTCIGFWLSSPAEQILPAIVNRILAVLAIWVTAGMALTQRLMGRELMVQTEKELACEVRFDIQAERVRVLKATMRTVQDIVGNFLNNLRLFQMEVEQKHTLSRDSLEYMDSLIEDTADRIRKLSAVDKVEEKTMAGGAPGIDYGDTAPARAGEL